MGQQWKIYNFSPNGMRLRSYYLLMCWSFWQNFITIGPKLYIFYYWPIFWTGSFFSLQSLFVKCAKQFLIILILESLRSSLVHWSGCTSWGRCGKRIQLYPQSFYIFHSQTRIRILSWYWHNWRCWPWQRSILYT